MRIQCLIRRIDDGDWSTEPSHVCTWNLFSPKLNPKKADVVIDVPTAVTALCCHPRQASVIAGTVAAHLCHILSQSSTCVCVCLGGLYNGRVVVWDTSQTDDPVLAQTGISADSHREPVCEVSPPCSSIKVPPQNSSYHHFERGVCV